MTLPLCINLTTGIVFILAIMHLYRARPCLTRGTFLFYTIVSHLYFLSIVVPPLMSIVLGYQPLDKHYSTIPVPALWYAFAISLLVALFVLVGTHFSLFAGLTRQYYRTNKKKTLVFDVCAILLLLIVNFLGYKFGTLKVGLDVDFALPLRLNGVIENILLFGCPFFIFFRLSRYRYGIMVSFGLLTVICIMYLIMTGSKWAALFPALVAILFCINNRLRIRSVIPILAIFFIIYGVLNPYYFRVAIRKEGKLNIVTALTESLTSRMESDYVGGRGLLRGFWFMSNRLNGFYPMCWCIDDAQLYPHFKTNVYTHINRSLMIEPGTNVGTGFFGFFMSMLGNAPLGIVAAFLTLTLFAWINFRIERIFPDSFMSFAYCCSLLPILLQGKVEYLGSYFSIAFNMATVYFIEYVYTVVRSEGTTTRFYNSKSVILRKTRFATTDHSNLPRGSSN